MFMSILWGVHEYSVGVHEYSVGVLECSVGVLECFLGWVENCSSRQEARAEWKLRE